jgi:2-phosphosulfolactate phosphatase
MEIAIEYFREGAKKAKGVCVVIDVFRACSVMYYVARQNPAQMIISYNYDEIQVLKNQNPGAIVIGKNHKPPDDLFNVYNSPLHVLHTNMSDKSVIIHSEGGVNSMIAANSADEVIAGGFVNAQAIANYMNSKSINYVTLVCTGILGRELAIEDNLCAEYIISLINKHEFDFENAVSQIRKTAGTKFLEGDQYYPPDDFDLCMDLNKFDFILKREKYLNNFILNKLDL